MSEFNPDLEKLLNVYDSNWDDYLILRKQLIEKYSLSVDKLEDHLQPYRKEMFQKIRNEKMPLVTAEEFVTVISENDKLKAQLNNKVKALTEIRANIEEHNQIYDLSTETASLLEGIDGIAFDALEAEEEE